MTRDQRTLVRAAVDHSRRIQIRRHDTDPGYRTPQVTTPSVHRHCGLCGLVRCQCGLEDWIGGEA